MSLSEIDPADMSREQLIAYCYSLEAQINSEEAMRSNAGRGKLQAFFKLTVKEAQVLASLADGRLYTKERLLVELYSDRGDDTPEPKIIDVFVCKLRRKVAPYGVSIETLWGTGYQLANPALIEKVIEGAQLDLVEDPPTVGSRKAGTFPSKTDNMRLRALTWLAEQMGSEERLAVRPVLVAKAVSAAISGAALLAQLERVGRIAVHSRMRKGDWVVSLTGKGREILADG